MAHIRRDAHLFEINKDGTGTVKGCGELNCELNGRQAVGHYDSCTKGLVFTVV